MKEKMKRKNSFINFTYSDNPWKPLTYVANSDTKKN